MNKKEFEDVLRETFGDTEVDIEKDLNKNNIFIAEDEKQASKLRQKIKENRALRADLSSAKRDILSTIDSLTEHRVDLEKKYTKTKVFINTLEIQSKNMFTVYEGIVGSDFGTMAMALMLEYNPTHYNKLKFGERYSVSRLKKGVNKDDALKAIKEINDEKKIFNEIDEELSKVKYQINELDIKRHEIDIDIHRLDIDYKCMSNSNRFDYIGISDLDTDIYIDPVDFGLTLKKCFGANGTGVLRGIKIC